MFGCSWEPKQCTLGMRANLGCNFLRLAIYWLQYWPHKQAAVQETLSKRKVAARMFWMSKFTTRIKSQGNRLKVDWSAANSTFEIRARAVMSILKKPEFPIVFSSQLQSEFGCNKQG